MKKKNNVTKVIGLLIAVGLIALFATRGGGVEYEGGWKYETFSQCLYDSGMRMYGSATCSACERQRRLFGESFNLIQEIECDPRNPDSEYERCIGKGISHTPTWILEDEEGEDLHRFESGVVSLEALSEVSKCQLL